MAWSLPEGSVLGIFGKRPEPGRVKTRLAAAIGPEAAAHLHEAMLFDLLDLWDASGVLAPGGRKVLVFDPGDAGPWFDERVPASYALQPQADGDLGSRMAEFFAGEFEEGATRVVLIGSDAPTLDPSFVVGAFLALEGRDVVLGPATDGGYYLVGCRHAVPPIFERIDWSTPEVLAQTIDRLDGKGLSVAVLPPWYDVDTPEGVRMLRGHLRAMRRAGMDPMLARTEAWLERNTLSSPVRP
jgi:rSAM/selenodomain-associated transferase 1